jgi:hypothetical protein
MKRTIKPSVVLKQNPSLTDYLIEFIDLIPTPSVIGGVWALKLHGLIVRDTQDLDIIIYNPQEVFIDKLKKLLEDGAAEEGSIFNPKGNNRHRSYKITRNGLTIDFLLEFDKLHPLTLLTLPKILDLGYVGYVLSDLSVQSIAEVIAAKKLYHRDKDLKDFEDFKRDNF